MTDPAWQTITDPAHAAATFYRLDLGLVVLEVDRAYWRPEADRAWRWVAVRAAGRAEHIVANGYSATLELAQAAAVAWARAQWAAMGQRLGEQHKGVEQ